MLELVCVDDSPSEPLDQLSAGVVALKVGGDDVLLHDNPATGADIAAAPFASNLGTAMLAHVALAGHVCWHAFVEPSGGARSTHADRDVRMGVRHPYLGRDWSATVSDMSALIDIRQPRGPVRRGKAPARSAARARRADRLRLAAAIAA